MFLVTGGAGFIGLHLVDYLLSRGHCVRVLDNFSTGRRDDLPSGIDVVSGDIRDMDALTRSFRGVSGCFHLAAIASVQRSFECPRETTDINVSGTAAVLSAAARQVGVPVVYASSAAIYGGVDQPLISEASSPAPLSPYAADKYANELHAHAFGSALGLKSFGLRLFNVYGPRQDPFSPYSGVISIFRQRAAANEEMIIYGDGSQCRDFIHVNDVVRFFAAAMERSDRSAPVANVCTGTGTTIAALANMMMRLHGGQIVYKPQRSGDIRRSVGSPSNAAETLGVTAEINLEEGLKSL